MSDATLALLERLRFLCTDLIPDDTAEEVRGSIEVNDIISCLIDTLPAAVPDDVAKDAARYRWLRDGDNGGVLSVGALTGVSDMGWERVTWIYDEALDAAIDAAILAADTEGRKDGGAR